MLNQEYLNKISLAEASVQITKALVDERVRLRERRLKLEDLKQDYQRDYVNANTGDASENAPLEEAIKNLKTITGDIVAVIKKQQCLDMIDDGAFVNATFDFSVIMDGVNAMSPRSQEFLCTAFKASGIEEIPDKIREFNYDEFVNAILEFDGYWSQCMSSVIAAEYPLDSPMWANQTELNKVINEKLNSGIMSAEYQVLGVLEGMKQVKVLPSYNSCGIIVPYTTVRLRRDNIQYTYKIYPKGVSLIDEGVLDGGSRLAMALMGRHVGDSVFVRHASKGTDLRYEIIDIY